MAKGFGELLSESWKEYKENIGFFIILCSLLLLLPLIVSFAFNIFSEIQFNNVNFQNTEDFKSILDFYLMFMPFIFIIILVSVTFNMLLSSSLVYFSLHKKGKMKVSFAIKGGLKYFWRLLGFSALCFVIIFIPIIILFLLIDLIVYFYSFLGVILTILLVILVILLMIAYIIFVIYLSVNWIFTYYIIIAENKKIIESMKKSSILVKKDWWTVFGYVLLLGLIFFGINFGISMVCIPFNFSALLISNLVVKAVISNLINLIFNLISTMIITPFAFLFLKNFYLDRKK
jgi:hypothetical protein